jgi:hypothetical protein
MTISINWNSIKWSFPINYGRNQNGEKKTYVTLKVLTVPG